jgi:hypothetical protein
MAYDVSYLTARIQRKAKDTSFSSTLITEFLDEVQTEVIGDQWFKFLESEETATLSINDTSRAYPTLQQATYRIWLTDTSTTPDTPYLIKYLPPEKFYKFYPTPALYTAGLPRHWTDFAGTVYFNCPLDKAYGYTLQYQAKAGTLDGSTDVPNIPIDFQGIYIQGAMAKVEEYRENFDIAAVYERKREVLEEQMQVRYALRQLGESETVYGPWDSRSSNDPWGE